MQFFYLFSFVVAASYAVALPQPAELSEKYSNNADTTLASGLEARSYQPVLNSYKKSATLMSLKRRDDSEGSVEDNSEGSLEANSEESSEDNSEGSGTPPPPDTTPDDSEGSPEEDSGSDSSPPPDTTPDEPFIDPFTEDAVSTENIASTIDNVGDGNADLYPKGEMAGRVIGDYIGLMIAKYFRKSTYVTVALKRWVNKSMNSMLRTIRSGLSDDKYSWTLPFLTNVYNEWEDEFTTRHKKILGYTLSILKDPESAVDNFQRIHRSFEYIFTSQWNFLSELRLRLDFEDGKTLRGYVSDIIKSQGEFVTKQEKFYYKIMKEFKAKYPQE
ncbi:hypothetical protein BASA83_009607 [Batrachochytrium salamandrivorans]|nr:hypothetical protein BASA81_016778 [Batrachochytrium salamandrivorans]KAH9267898.1 hypothetical protein BASA83_009607 [Batrachochytrium salamandrivorans]